jgi:exoribonuclease-2
MVHLSRNPGWRGEAVVVALEERKAVVIIPELALETRIRLSPDFSLGQTLMLGVREVDVPAQNAYFRIL